MNDPMNAAPEPSVQAAPEGVVPTMLAVITAPAAFYRVMPKTGGFAKPLVFAVIMGVVSGLIQAVLFALGVKTGAGLYMAVASLILTPILVAIFSFIGAGLAWISWKLLGSQESYETAYRCSAYASAITPITSFAGIIPLIGPSVGMIWMTWLVIISSVEVHKIAKRRAQLVFGALCAFFVLVSIAGQIAARAMKEQIQGMAAENAGQINQLAEQLKGAQTGMTPEQQKALNAVMAQLQQASQQGQQPPQAPAPQEPAPANPQ